MELPFHDLIQANTGPLIRVRPAVGGSGFSTTAVVTPEEGPQVFVKGVPNRPGGRRDAAHREAAIAPHLNGLGPALLWQVEDQGWFVAGYEVVDGRPADFTPASPDLPRVVEAAERVGALDLPSVAEKWGETRWDRFTDRPGLLSGATLTHTDLHPHNILLARGQTWVVDWEWPTLAAGFVTAGCLVGQLIAAGHSAADAEYWVSRGRGWKNAAPEAIDEFARAQVRMQKWVVQMRPEDGWRVAMLDAARAWEKHRGA